MKINLVLFIFNEEDIIYLYYKNLCGIVSSL